MNDPLIIEVIREGAKLKMGAFNRSEQNLPLSSYTERQISEDEIIRLSNEIVEFLNQANRLGTLEHDLLKELKKTGWLLYEMLFTDQVKDRLRQDQSLHLILFIDEKLIQIPWELLFDGDDFLCLKYALGRMVRTKQRPRNFEHSSIKTSQPRMLILANPTGDLQQASIEAKSIREALEPKLHVDVWSANIDLSSFKKEIHDYDIVHFAGHADYDANDPSSTGWILRKEEGDRKAVKFSVQDIAHFGSSKPLPTLIFSNACESARTEKLKGESESEEAIFGLANAFLLGGSKYYVGTFWKMADKGSSTFAQEFYKSLSCGISIGEAVKISRELLLKRFKAESAVWTSYVLYGDPSGIFFGHPAQAVIETKGFWMSRGTQFLAALALLLTAIVVALLVWRRDVLHLP